MKRCCLTDDDYIADVSSLRQSLRVCVNIREAKEAKEARNTTALTASRSSFGDKRRGYAMPRHFRDKDWEIDGLDDVEMTEDNSLWCTVRLKPTIVNTKTIMEEYM